MIRVAITVFFFASVIMLPWFAPLILGVALVVVWRGYIEVILGGILLDIVFGAPIASLSDFSFLYTALFIFLSLLAVILRRAIIE